MARWKCGLNKGHGVCSSRLLFIPGCQESCGNQLVNPSLLPSPFSQLSLLSLWCEGSSPGGVESLPRSEAKWESEWAPSWKGCLGMPQESAVQSPRAALLLPLLSAGCSSAVLLSQALPRQEELWKALASRTTLVVIWDYNYIGLQIFQKWFIILSFPQP